MEIELYPYFLSKFVISWPGHFSASSPSSRMGEREPPRCLKSVRQNESLATMELQSLEPSPRSLVVRRCSFSFFLVVFSFCWKAKGVGHNAKSIDSRGGGPYFSYPFLDVYMYRIVDLCCCWLLGSFVVGPWFFVVFGMEKLSSGLKIWVWVWCPAFQFQREPGPMAWIFHILIFWLLQRRREKKGEEFQSITTSIHIVLALTRIWILFADIRVKGVFPHCTAPSRKLAPKSIYVYSTVWAWGMLRGTLVVKSFLAFWMNGV